MLAVFTQAAVAQKRDISLLLTGGYNWSLQTNNDHNINGEVFIRPSMRFKNMELFLKYGRLNEEVYTISNNNGLSGQNELIVIDHFSRLNSYWNFGANKHFSLASSQFRPYLILGISRSRTQLENTSREFYYPQRNQLDTREGPQNPIIFNSLQLNFGVGNSLNLYKDLIFLTNQLEFWKNIHNPKENHLDRISLSLGLKIKLLKSE